MNLKIINVIIGREYLTRVKKKSFLITTFLVPILFALVTAIPSLIMFLAKDELKLVAVVDESSLVLSSLEDSKQINYEDYSKSDYEELKTSFDSLGVDALLHISPLDSASKSLSVESYSKKPLSVDMKMNIENKVDSAIEAYRRSTYDIEGLKEIIEDINSDIAITSYVVGDDGEAKLSSSEVFMGISLLLSMAIYMFVALFSGMVMQGVIEEKSTRVVEVLVSSVKATELMFGKIIGIACVALTQFLLWVVLTSAIVLGISTFVGFDTLLSGAKVQTEQMDMMTEGMGVTPEQMATTGMITPSFNPEEYGEVGVVIETLMNINYGQIIVCFIIFFVFGFLLYASLFAAIGSAVEDVADSNQLQIPVTIPLMLAFFIAFYAFRAPDSAVVFWGSMIPLTSPIVMLARIPFGVPTWELVLSIGILIISFVIIAYISAKIYKAGILIFGKKTTFKDLYKWLKQK